MFRVQKFGCVCVLLLNAKEDVESGGAGRRDRHREYQDSPSCRRYLGDTMYEVAGWHALLALRLDFQQLERSGLTTSCEYSIAIYVQTHRMGARLLRVLPPKRAVLARKVVKAPGQG